MVDNRMDIDDVLYTVPAGSITVHDVIYGQGIQIEGSGVNFYAHRRGFTVKSLINTFQRCGFEQIRTTTAAFEIHALAFKKELAEPQRA